MSRVIEHVREIYLDDGKNCAETLLEAALRSRGRLLSEEGRLAMLGFSGGLSVGSVCGVITGGVAAIGCLLGGEDALRQTRCKDAAAAYYALCREAFSSADCEKIKPVYRREETRCLLVVEHSAELLERVLTEYGV